MMLVSRNFNYQLFFGLLCVAGGALSASATYKYLHERPSFLEPCKLHDQSGNNKCFARAIENLYSHWKDVTPPTKSQRALDPFHVKKIRFAQQAGNVADVQSELRDLVMTGLSKVKVLNASIDENDYTFHVHFLLPYSLMTGDYKMKGRVLLLNLDGQGQFENKLYDVEYIVTVKVNLKQVDNEYFFDIISQDTKIKSIGNFKTHLTNLFNGNKELEDSANELFNQNWRELHEVMHPAVSRMLDTITVDRTKNFFRYLPAKFFFSDLP